MLRRSRLSAGSADVNVSVLGNSSMLWGCFIVGFDRPTFCGSINVSLGNSEKKPTSSEGKFLTLN